MNTVTHPFAVTHYTGLTQAPGKHMSSEQGLGGHNVSQSLLGGEPVNQVKWVHSGE